MTSGARMMMMTRMTRMTSGARMIIMAVTVRMNVLHVQLTF
jgi:hypothetical protein